MNDLTKCQQEVLEIIRLHYGSGDWFYPDTLPHPQVKRAGYVCSLLYEKNRLNRTFSKEAQAWKYQLAVVD